MHAPTPVAAAIAAALAGAAHADLIVYDNSSGVFVWEESHESTGIISRLDITAPPEDQSPERRWAVPKWYVNRASSDDTDVWFFGAPEQYHLYRIVSQPRFIYIYEYEFCLERQVWPVQVMRPGDVVDADADIDIAAPWRIAPYCSKKMDVLAGGGYIGVAVALEDDFHFGWIRLDAQARPVAWAYETQPFVPAPIPGCRADCGMNGRLDINDFVCFQSEWRKRTAYGDYNGDGMWSVNDFIAYQASFLTGCQ